MTSLQTFITMFETFLNELSETFPENKGISSYVVKFEILKKSNPRSLLNMFVEHTKPYANYINDKDESLFIDELVPFLKDMGFKECWEHDTTSENTKNAIWAHLASLHFFATTIAAIPEGLMNNIEMLAQQYAGQLSESPTMNMNPNVLMENMQQMMQMQMTNENRSKLK